MWFWRVLEGLILFVSVLCLTYGMITSGHEAELLIGEVGEDARPYLPYELLPRAVYRWMRSFSPWAMAGIVLGFLSLYIP